MNRRFDKQRADRIIDGAAEQMLALDHTPSPDFRARVMARVEAESHTRVHDPPTPERHLPWWYVWQNRPVAAVAVSAVLVVAVGVGFQLQFRSDLTSVKSIDVERSVVPYGASEVARAADTAEGEIAWRTPPQVEFEPAFDVVVREWAVIPPEWRARFGDIDSPPSVADYSLFVDRVVDVPIASDELTWFRLSVPENGTYAIHVRADQTIQLPEARTPGRVDPILLLYAVAAGRPSLRGHDGDGGGVREASLSIALEAGASYFLGTGSLMEGGMAQVSLATDPSP